MKPICKAWQIAALGVLLALVAGMASILFDGLTDDVKVSDVGIVLGSQVLPDGTPSARLRARLDKAGDLYQQGMFKHLIVSGGTGKEGYNEAVVMADYLATEKKVPREAIILDEHGNTTQATAQNSAALMKKQDFTSALVVTQYFHITRSRYALHCAGIPTVHTAHPRYFEVRDLYSIAREMVALPAYFASGKPTIVSQPRQ